MQEQLDERRKAAEKVTLIGSVVDLLLGVAKIVVGFFANSAALIADGVHSLSDLATDFLVIVVLRISHQAPDKNHPYGHGRFETVGTVALGVILIAVGATLAFELASKLFEGPAEALPTWPALFVAGLSIISKEWIFRYSLKIGKELKSDLLIANAWHSRTDALSSVVVFVALIGAMLGVWWLDAVAAIAVAALIGKIGWDLVIKSLTELVDTALPEERVKELRAAVMEVEGIISVHGFKTRAMGNQAILEMHLQVASNLSASEGHYLGDQVVCVLQSRFDDIGHVIFHIDTYDDQPFHDQSCPIMPTRAEIRTLVDQALGNLTDQPKPYEMSLYYRPNSVDVELKLSQELSAQLDDQSISHEQLYQSLNEGLTKTGWFRNLKVWHPAA